MKYYLKLQLKQISRQFIETGFNPLFGFLLLLVGFSAFSWFLFQKTEYASYIYVVLAVMVTGNLSERKRTEFLKLNFQHSNWRKIRLLENLIVLFPFVLFLCLKQQFIAVLMLIAIGSFLSVLSVRTRFQVVVPTPFSKRPFEFTVGFRKTFYLYGAAYLLTVIALNVNNFNLGIFSLLVIFAVAMSYYTTPEDEWFVWSHSMHPKQFLFHKIKIALIYSSFLASPVFVAMSIYYPSEIHIIGLFLLAGYSFLISMIVAKYAAYPSEINLVEGILITFGIAFPLLLLIIVPYFFNKSVKSLNPLLR